MAQPSACADEAQMMQHARPSASEVTEEMKISTVYGFCRLASAKVTQSVSDHWGLSKQGGMLATAVINAVLPT